MKVEYHKSFERDLRKVRDRTLLDRVKVILLELEESETLETILSVKPMKGYPEYFRIRIGDYRLGLKRTNDGLRIIRFLCRGDIYRKFP
jgi:mRNA interferase RelE/StbE